MNLFLIGFMGTGKSTIGKELQKRLGMTLVEMDRELEIRDGRPIPDIFRDSGEAYFRSLETEFLSGLSGRDGLIVSCGGGAALRPENAALMHRSGRVFLLTAKPETILERVKDGGSRPVLAGHMNTEYIEKLMEKRRPFYEKAADYVIATDGKTTAEICRLIEKRLP